MRTIVRKVDKTRAEWTARKTVDYLKQGKLVLDNAVQRGFVWNKDVVRMSEFILSLIFERPIPPIYVAKFGDTYSAMDGKQRITTIQKFMNDEFALEGLEPVEIDDDETGEREEADINTLTFSELEESLQDAIKDSALTVIILNEPTDDEMCEFFYYLNNGMPLNAITSTRAKAKSRKEITELGTHELFKNALTAKAFERYTNEDIVVKSYAMLHMEEPSMETKVIRPLMAEIDITDADKKQLTEIFDRILEMHKKIEDTKIAKRLLTRTHMVSVVPIVWKSLQDGLSDKQMVEWFVEFFAGKKAATISPTYNTYAGSGSARKEAVRNRLEAIEEDYNKFFEKTALAS